MKRFYKKIDILQSERCYQVTLDKSPLKTPLKSILQLPTKKLARKIAEEWSNVETEIIPEKGLFKIKYQTTQKNWVIVEAMQKPFINFMWIGFFILTLGLALSFNKIKLKRI